MPRQPTIVRRVVQWVRNRISSSREAEEAEEQRRLLEERRQHRAVAYEQRQRERVITFNRWIERQRNIALRQAEGQYGAANPAGGPFIYRIQLAELPVGVERISRSLVWIIEENGVRFRFDMVHVYDEHVTWAVSVVLLDQ